MKKWPFKKLSEIAISISAGGTPRRNIQEYWESGTIPWLKISDLKNTYIQSSEEKITEKGLKESSAKFFPKGTVVYSIFATLGAIAILDMEATSNQAIAGIVPNNKIIHTKYLYYCLKSERTNILKKKSHGTQDNINLGILKNHEIPIPPLPVQKQIVSILEQAEKLKDRRTKTNNETNKIIQSVFYEMFGDPVRNNTFPIKKFGEVCLFIRGPFGGSLKKEIFQTEGYAIYEQQHAIGDNFSNIRYFVTEEKFNEMKRFELKSGDLIMSCSGTMGKVAIVPFGIKKGIINQALLKLTPNKNISILFLKHWLESESFQNSLKVFSQGAAIQNVASVKILKEIKLPLPPIELQNQFASIVKQIESLKQKQSKSTDDLNQLFDALMQKAFKGELVA